MSVLLFSVQDAWHPVELICPLMYGTYVCCAQCVVCFFFLIVQYVLKLDLCLSEQRVKSDSLENVLK